MSILPVTVVIPVKNEERNLPACLAALGERWDEIVVVDSGSTDRTRAIVAESRATLVDFAWNGQFPKKRNWYLENATPRNDWCLFLDADEVVTAAFTQEVAAALAQTDKVGFWLHYTNYFLGKPLRYGLAQRKLALFRRSAGRFERIEEDRWSDLDMEIHEHPQLVGEVGDIAARIDHRDFQGLGKFITRHLDYARWEAGRYIAVRNSAEFGDLTQRQRAKYRHIERGLFPFGYFLFNYFIRLGILDGWTGLQYSFYKAWYFNTIRLLIREHDANAHDRETV